MLTLKHYFCYAAVPSYLFCFSTSIGSDVGGRGEHILLLSARGPEVPLAVGAAGSLRSDGGGAEPGGSQATQACRLWQSRSK